MPAGRTGALAQPLATDHASGQPIKVIDVSAPPKNDSGGAGAVSTAADYLRFSQMLLNGGQLEGVRVLSRTTVELMTSDHLGSRITAPLTPGELLLGTPGYGFGLGFAVRLAPGIAGVPGSAGEFMWAGYAGTYFWVDPKEQVDGGVHEPGAEPDPRLLPQAGQAVGVSGDRRLTVRGGGRRPHPAARYHCPRSRPEPDAPCCGATALATAFTIHSFPAAPATPWKYPSRSATMAVRPVLRDPPMPPRVKSSSSSTCRSIACDA